uniref:Uncharacterized protein n=1 Tax=Globisporangium ultimum (strain ATCC 200006 / CBS 805.95 / DAOM BR144) TaxID=431595 RepID=K3WQ66_GLOUD
MSAQLAPLATSPPVANSMDSKSVEQQVTTESINTCRYPSKKCWNPRALKRNGELHNLCDLHRQKANKNQRRLELKRKTKKIAVVKRTRKSRKKKQPATMSAIAPIKQVPAPVVMTVNAPALLSQPQLNTLPTGFFTDLMMADSFQTKQLDTMAMTSHHQFQPMYQPLQLNLTPEFLVNDLDTLTQCLDSIPSLATMLGNSSPIDVCEEIDAIAVTGSDFWSYPVVESNGINLLFMDAALVASDGSLAFHP